MIMRPTTNEGPSFTAALWLIALVIGLVVFLSLIAMGN